MTQITWNCLKKTFVNKIWEREGEKESGKETDTQKERNIYRERERMKCKQNKLADSIEKSLGVIILFCFNW